MRPNRSSRTTTPKRQRRIASRLVSWYLRTSPIEKGKDAIWRSAAKRFLVTELIPGVWIRTSGLTDTEKMLFLRGNKEPLSVRFVDELLKPGMVVFDVGANIGYYTLIFAERVGCEGEVHAFEPTPPLAERLRLNVEMNTFKQVRVNEFAVADTIGTASLHLSSEDPEANSLFQQDLGAGRLSVATVTLDAYAKAVGAKRLDLVKIDCEGSEIHVLKGASTLFRCEDGPVILLECNPASLLASGGTVAELCGCLRASSYKCYCLEQLREGPNPVWNLLALKPSHSRAYQLVDQFCLKPFGSN
jgi:FkbM family methyltransferase